MSRNGLKGAQNEIWHNLQSQMHPQRSNQCSHSLNLDANLDWKVLVNTVHVNMVFHVVSQNQYWENFYFQIEYIVSFLQYLITSCKMWTAQLYPVKLTSHNCSYWADKIESLGLHPWSFTKPSLVWSPSN